MHGRRLLLPLIAMLALAPPVHGQSAARIDTVAGGAGVGFAGDGGPATAARLFDPQAIAPLPGGGYLIADTDNQRIRRVDAGGTITTVAGTGTAGYNGDGIAATTAQLDAPTGVAALPDGGLLIADEQNDRVRRVDAGGVISTVAGTGTQGYNGDGIAATSAQVSVPGGVAPLPDGDVLIADTGNHRIRRVGDGVISTIAGTGASGFGGDGGPATAASLSTPFDVVPLAGGGFLIADTGNHRIRRVNADATIETIAGNGTSGFGGDGGPATAAALDGPNSLGVLPDGGIAIADSGNARIRLVGADGAMRTLAGIGGEGFGGDGGPPAAAQLSAARDVKQDGARLLIADAGNHRVRAITAVPGQPPPRQPPPGVSRPVIARSASVIPSAGTVLVRLPGRRRFVRLRTAANLPLGSEIDARRGTVTVLFETTRAGRIASAIVSGGRFVIRQPNQRDGGQRPGELKLSGPLANCARRAGKEARASAKRRKRGRRIKVNAHGKIRTRGRYGSGISRGTRWTTVDRCATEPRPGTLFTVQSGRVAVRSFVLGRTRIVRAGRSLLAPARRR